MQTGVSLQESVTKSKLLPFYVQCKSCIQHCTEQNLKNLCSNLSTELIQNIVHIYHAILQLADQKKNKVFQIVRPC